MSEKTCGNCNHFIQHYIRVYKTGGQVRYIDINCGYCIYPKFKRSEQNRKACQYWKEI